MACEQMAVAQAQQCACTVPRNAGAKRVVGLTARAAVEKGICVGVGFDVALLVVLATAPAGHAQLEQREGRGMVFRGEEGGEEGGHGEKERNGKERGGPRSVTHLF